MSRIMALSVAVLFAWANTSHADFITTEESNATNLLNALLGDTTGLSGFSASIGAGTDTRAYGTFSGDPFGLGSGIVLSTGQVTQIPGVNTVSGPAGNNDLSTDLSGTDNISLTINFTADTNVAQNLFFRFVFGSEEFLEYSGTQFNDSFTLTLNGTNLAKLTDSQTVTINNLTPNSTTFHPDYVNNPAGAGTLTKLGGYTIIETFQGSLLNGSNQLVIRIQDVGDSVWDSAVFVQGNSLGVVVPPDNGVVPEPSSIALVTVGLVGFAGYQRRRRANRS